MTTLTDRYVTATLRRVPEKQRTEIEKELRAAIADDVDARTEQGEKADKAEYETLKELGDPYRLAASYTNHSLTLIGPDIYPAFVRSLKLVLGISLPIVFIVLATISFAQHENVFASIFGPLGSMISVGIYITFAITVIFALLERTQNRASNDDKIPAWTPDALAVEIDTPNLSKWGDAISPLVGAIFLIGFLLIDRFSPFVKTSSGDAVPVIDQHLWSLWLPVIIAVLVLQVVVDFVKAGMRTWRVGTAIAETLIGLLGAAALIALVSTTRVVNPALTSSSLFAPGSWLTVLVAIVIGVIWLATTINLWRPSTRRPRPAS